MVWFLQRSPHLTFAVLCDVSIRLTNYVMSSGVTQTEITWSRPIRQTRHGRGESVRRARRDAIASERVRACVRPADLINYHQMYPHLSALRLAATSLLPVIGRSSLVGGTTTLPSTAALFPAGCNELDSYMTRGHHLRLGLQPRSYTCNQFTDDNKTKSDEIKKHIFSLRTVTWQPWIPVSL